MMSKSSAQTKWSRRRGIVISAGVLILAGAVVAVMMVTSNPTASALAGASPSSSSDGMSMDHGADMPASPPSPTGSGDMPGMSAEEHGSGDMTGSSPSPTGSGEMPGMSADEHRSGDMPGMSTEEHGKTEAKAVDRPLATVLGTFGGGTSAVLLGAGLLRRKDRARSQAKQAARAARRARS